MEPPIEQLSEEGHPHAEIEEKKVLLNVIFRQSPVVLVHRWPLPYLECSSTLFNPFLERGKEKPCLEKMERRATKKNSD